MKKILVAGAGGFVGGHLVNRLVRDGHEVCATDHKPLHEWKQRNADANSFLMDAADPVYLPELEGVQHVYNFAASMGGMGFIESNKLLCMRNVLINTHLIEHCLEEGVERYFFASTACVYPHHIQTVWSPAMAEDMAYPAWPEDGYGWEKLFSERMCLHYQQETALETRVGRLHNVYGPHMAWDGGREKVIGALCRKVVQKQDPLQVWGDGTQERSFTFVDDTVEGIIRLMNSDHSDPVNIGSAERVTINQLLDSIEQVAGHSATRSYILKAPQGVAGRSSDNSLIRRLFGWEPSTKLADGLVPTYEFIREQVSNGEG